MDELIWFTNLMSNDEVVIMKKKILISSFDLAIGGVERSLIGLLQHLDYTKYEIDLLLFKHEGEFLSFLPEGPNLLNEIPQYTTFRKSIKEIIKEGYYQIGITRLMGKTLSVLQGRLKGIDEPGYLNIQYGWEMVTPFLPKLHKEYDVAIGFLWPHHFIGEKVNARKKIGWVHTDYSNIYLNKKAESRMWNKLDKVVAVSEECSSTFLKVFPSLKERTTVIENILSAQMVREQANFGIPKEIESNSDHTILVTVGRLSHAKGIDRAIRACKKLVNLGYSIKWYVIGYGALEEELTRLIYDLELQEHFFLLGKKVNPYPYIKTADIYVQPSRYEGKAVTIREAQILGKPVLITNFPTAKSQAKDGYDAMIVDSNVEGIVKGIKRFIDDEQYKNNIINNIKNTSYGNENEIEKLYQLIDS
jgi:glycosyltransferase involved in cell wall biosynthesis